MQRTLNNLISTNVFAYFIASFGGRIALDGAVKKAKMFDSLSTFFYQILSTLFQRETETSLISTKGNPQKRSVK
jgi:hypothetical protein